MMLIFVKSLLSMSYFFKNNLNSKVELYFEKKVIRVVIAFVIQNLIERV